MQGLNIDFSKARIGARIGLGFAALVILLFVVAALAITRLNRAATLSRNVEAVLLPERAALAQMAFLMQRYRTLEYAHLSALNPDDQPPIESQMNKLVSNITAEAETIRRLDPASIDVAKPWRDYTDYFEKTIREDSRSGMANVATRRMVGEHEMAFDKIVSAIAGSAKRVNEAVELGDRDLESERRSTVALLLGVSAAAVMLGVIVAWLTAASVAKPLAEVVRFAGDIAGGNLRTDLPRRAPGEFRQLVAALLSMRDRLSQVVRHVQNGIAQVEGSSQDIAASAADLSERNEHQASQVSVVTGAIVGLRDGVIASATAAAHGREMMGQGVAEAQESRELMSEVVKRMVAIADATLGIEQITATIDAIAFQTSLLALNAAVEAANAGEHGKGFSVVANEVRALSKRSAEAAQNINELSRRARQEMRSGEEASRRANESVDRILNRVNEIAGNLDQIAGHVSQQSGQLSSISRSMSAIDDLTQRNAALAEQSAAAAESMLEQAGQLKALALQFQLPDEAHAEPIGVDPETSQDHIT